MVLLEEGWPALQHENDPSEVHCYVSRPDHFVFRKWTKQANSIADAFGPDNWELCNEEVTLGHILKHVTDGCDCMELLACTNGYGDEGGITIKFRNVNSVLYPLHVKYNINHKLWGKKVYDTKQTFTTKWAMQLHVFKLKDALAQDSEEEEWSPDGVPMWTIGTTDKKVMDKFNEDKETLSQWNNEAAMESFVFVAFTTYFPFEAGIKRSRLA